MKTAHSRETLQAALEAIQNLDAGLLALKFRKFEHACAPGTYCALVLEPATGGTNTVNEASWSCSTDEYFSESGVLSRQTLLSSTRAHWSPSPDDGFEWTDGEDYVHPAGDPAGWIAAEKFQQLGEDEQAKYTEWFSVSDTPVDGWLEGADDMIEDVEKQIAELCAAIGEALELEISEIEESEGRCSKNP